MKKILLILFCLASILSCSVNQKMPLNESFQKIIDADYRDRGFVIYEEPVENGYVQYAREEKGLMLVWPYYSDFPGHQIEDINLVKKILNDNGFIELSVEQEIDRQFIENMEPGEYFFDQSDNEEDFPGIYAIFETDVIKLEAITKTFFEKIYGYTRYENIKTQLVLKNQ